MELVKAKLTYIIFMNEQNHYLVGSFSDLDTYHIFTAAGRINDPEEDADYELEGNYVQHPKYGKQFQITSAKRILPTNEKQILRFLTSELFSGIGKKTAQSIYDALGETCLEQIAQDPSVLYQVPSLNHKKIESIEKGIQQFTGFNETYIELMKMGLSDSKIALLEATYKNALDIIKENCFTPYYEINGFGYKSAVLLANKLEMDPMDERRKDAYIYNLCRELSMSTGNTYISWTTVLHQAKGLSQQDVIDTLFRLKDSKYIEIQDQRVYPFTLYEDENTIARLVIDHMFKVEPIDEAIIESKITEAEFAYNITYDKHQKDVFYTFFNSSFSILNGGPGTGKTTIVKGILKICRSLFPMMHIQLCAPTGRASKRLAQLSDCDARTIHSLLQWDLETNTFKKDANDPLECDFLIVDEFSMVDTHLFSQLLQALPSHCRILLIGDENQLESVGPGKVFEDLIESNLLPVNHLNKIYRQANGSGIVTLAKEIREELPCHYEDGVEMIEMNAMDILQEIEYLTKELDMNSMQILAPMYKGIVGIDEINTLMQNLYNPYSKDKKELKVASTIFRVNDKVMLLKNMPDDDVYNGDIGTIVYIEKTKEASMIEVDFGNTIVDFTNDFLYYLTHAYCISVHKSQGSEYDTVIMIVDPGASYMLEKRLIYTGISRAKKKLYILGNQKLFEAQVRLKQKRIRQTTLKECLLKYKGEEYD